MNHSFLLKEGFVVAGDGIAQADLRIANGTIQEMGQNLSKRSGELLIDCSAHFVFPGLINSHDHLEFNLYPRLGHPPYRNAYEWGYDLHRDFKPTIEAIQKIPLSYRLWWGAWKNLFSGVTTVLHHNKYYRQFRIHFPLTVPKHYTFAHSIQFEKNIASALKKRRRDLPFVIHLAEGTDEVAFGEVSQLHALGGIDDRTVAVHCIGLEQRDIKLLQDARASLVWCPSSNLYLFGQTAPIRKLLDILPIALGTDSTLTGAPTMFDELRTAAKEARLSAQKVFQFVTDAPRDIFGLPPDAGSIIEGGKANLFLLRMNGSDPYQTLLKANVSDVELLIHNGAVKISSANFGLLAEGKNGYRIQIQGHNRLIFDRDFPTYFKEIEPFLKHYPYIYWSSTASAPARKLFISSRAIPKAEFVCPSCRTKLLQTQRGWQCKKESFLFNIDNEIPDFILPSRRSTVERFLEIYQTVRSNERWGSLDPEYYRAVPYRDITKKYSHIWKIRARTYDCFVAHLSSYPSAFLKILDLGAGNCWLSHRLAQMGHEAIALDVNVDPTDGLGVVKRLQDAASFRFQCVRAEFDYLPFPDESFDQIVFNASLHYSKDPVGTMTQSLRCLKEGGSVWILDSPLYQRAEDGEAMLGDRIREFRERHGLYITRDFAGGYLTNSELKALEHTCTIEYLQPHYGIRWRLKPITSFLLGRRKPAQFCVIKIRKRGHREA
jgi:cytosine/adenosine deaminase-related metal-dependent hydrolase/SAM-dependent methyltransferase